MSQFVESVTSQLVSKALDVSLQNHKVIANNIANVDTQGYRPLKLNFQEALGDVQQLIAQGASDADIKQAIKNVPSEPTPTVDELAVKVTVDQQMVELAKNTVNYQALLNAKGKLGSLMKMAIKGGR